MDQPNPFKAAFEILRSLLTVPAPQPDGPGELDHARVTPVLNALDRGGLPAAIAERGELELYLKEMAEVDPDALTRDESLAFWINLYNAAAVDLALDAMAAGHQSVLRDPGGLLRKASRGQRETAITQRHRACQESDGSKIPAYTERSCVDLCPAPP